MLIEQIYFFTFDGIKVIQTVILDRLDEISLCIFYLLRTKCKPFQECLLNNIFRIRLAANYVIGYCLQHRLIKNYSLLMIHRHKDTTHLAINSRTTTSVHGKYLQYKQLFVAVTLLLNNKW